MNIAEQTRDLLYRISVRDLTGIELRGVGSFDVVPPAAGTFGFAARIRQTRRRSS